MFSSLFVYLSVFWRFHIFILKGYEMQTSKKPKYIDEQTLKLILPNEKAKLNGLNHALTNFYKAHHTECIYNGDHNSILPEIEKFIKIRETKQDEKRMATSHNKPEAISNTGKFLEASNEFISKKWITTYCYGIEQQSVLDDDTKGIHCHILFNRNGKKPSEIKNETNSTFKQVCNKSNPAILNYRNLRDTQDIHKAYDYLVGTKASEDKLKEQYKDKIFRLNNNLMPFYKSTDFKIPDLIVNNATQKIVINEER